MKEKIKLTHSQSVGYDPKSLRERVIILLKENKPKEKHLKEIVKSTWCCCNIGVGN